MNLLKKGLDFFGTKNLIKICNAFSPRCLFMKNNKIAAIIAKIIDTIGKAIGIILAIENEHNVRSNKNVRVESTDKIRQLMNNLP